MAKIDISALSVAELNELIDEAKKLIVKKRSESLKALVDDLFKKSQDIHAPIAEVIAEIRKRESGSENKKPKVPNGNKAAPAWKKDVIYCNPADPSQDWVGGTKGPKPAWLTSIIPKSMSQADQTARYLELIKK